jgi:hypothetical protein
MMQPGGKDPNFMMWAGAAAFLVIVSWIAMRWLRRTVQKDLDPEMSGRMRKSMAMQADTVPPALVKEALQKGLVTAAQLATMSPIERQFLFNTLRPKLSGAAAPGTAGTPPSLLSPSAPALPLKPSQAAAPANPQQLRSTQAIMAIPGKPMSLPPLTPAQLAAMGPPPGSVPEIPAAPGVTPRAGSPAAARSRPSPAAGVAAASFGGEQLPDAAIPPMHCPFCGSRLVMPAFAPFVAFCDQCGAKTAVRTEDQGRLIINSAPPGVTRRPVG